MQNKFRNLLIIDDEPSMRHMLRLILEPEGYRIIEAENGEAALVKIRKEKFDTILSDIRMPDMDGLQFLAQPEVIESTATLIMMSAYGSIETALQCIKLGAYDYISKPFKADEILLTLRKAEERRSLQQENRQLRSKLHNAQDTFDLGQIVYRSRLMGEILESVTKVARSSSSVLIQGETGTGKELIARAIHSESGRSGRFLALNCSAISPGLIESELFGHVKGAFTDAHTDNQGLFIAASGGTLFLDEIAELPLDLQPKLLRVLQEGEVRSIGSSRSEKIDTRIVAACGSPLKESVANGHFRSDLFYRLAVVEIDIPPLRQRTEDIAPLARHFLETISFQEGRVPLEIGPEEWERLEAHSWPGNIRELRNYIEKALIFSARDQLVLPPLPGEFRRKNRNEAEDYSLKQAIIRIEREYILKALEKTGGNRTHAARLLEISLRSLLYKIKDYQIET